ncbi:MAG: 4'-phosphopantetheinyl transferase superfamily protein [Terriglobales bacterium]
MDVVRSQSWAVEAEKYELHSGRVDVWQLRLDEPELGISSPALDSPEGSLLAPDENIRAARFHFDDDRVRFTRCRTALRRLLGHYLDLAPANIRFTYTTNGKPEVAANQNPDNLRFNVSHSGNMALIAVGVADDLGVDIEKLRADVNTADLAERFFSVRERETLRGLPESLRLAAFFACWARKEAFLKAMGEGLGFPLADFSVSVHPGIEPRIEEIRGDERASREWSLIDVEAAEGFRSAVAIKHAGAAITMHSLR